jgi:serine/threonine protein phosphatase 1
MYLFNDTATTKLWQMDRKIGIDGGGVYGGSIHGVVFNPQGIVQDIELFNEHAWEPKFETH